jgi:gamma-glutamylcyclotransferase (GGCT)/AIG2-like uncharacterized protein YtfP
VIMPLAPQHLFVYGTLKRRAKFSALGRDMRQRLALTSDWRGPAATLGALYDLGEYPVLTDGDQIVHGELYRLDDPDTVFAWLDPYENVGGTGDREPVYRRLVRSVLAMDRTTVEAWVYLVTSAPPGARPLPDGRWPPSLK